ncbi:conjugal transfer protein TraD [Acidithiobacillus ferriphilus]|uniref:conjugal transfer protein TraD n=1 Tax=Acidithiobacillus ferriphilus TaxID=1689834 RepID=UPI00232BB64E|nr:conjugal transfer protein TraD [Acidithiobacillus ferriphilus]WCE92801.1 conjugal transfer protein TraD [Acidithiobacillus ferriphilus]
MTSQAENAKIRRLAALESARRAKETLMSIRKKQDRKKKLVECKNRNRKRFMLGSLVEMAGILEVDEDTLLGGLMALAKTLNDPAKSATTALWKQHGAAMLVQHEATRLKK